MTEVDWLACDNSRLLMEHLCGIDECRREGTDTQPKTYINPRKFRAFAVACLEIAGRARPDHYRRLETGHDENPIGCNPMSDFKWACSWASNWPPDSKPHPARAVVFRDVFGNPFRPVNPKLLWFTANAVALAQAIYDERAFERMPILADALEEAGCDDGEILNHCRGPNVHVRGCWVVDLVLGK